MRSKFIELTNTTVELGLDLPAWETEKHVLTEVRLIRVRIKRVCIKLNESSYCTEVGLKRTYRIFEYSFKITEYSFEFTFNSSESFSLFLEVYDPSEEVVTSSVIN